MRSDVQFYPGIRVKAGYGVQERFGKVPAGRNFREPSSERVYDSHSSISLPVTQVFGVDGAGSKRLSGYEGRRSQ